VTVRLGLRDPLGRDLSVRTRTIVHHHRLAEPLRHLRRHQASQDVDAAASREPDDDADRPRGEWLRESPASDERG
jgi:hypothetical protein